MRRERLCSGTEKRGRDSVRARNDAADVEVEGGDVGGRAEAFVCAEGAAELAEESLARAVWDEAWKGEEGRDGANEDEGRGAGGASELREDGAGEEPGEGRVHAEVGHQGLLWDLVDPEKRETTGVWEERVVEKCGAWVCVGKLT
jgi:hypothetical protein